MRRRNGCRHWREEAWLARTDEAWAQDNGQSKQRLADIEGALTKEQNQAKPRWYVTAQGLTMVVIPGPVEFLMGSPPTEEGRQSIELRDKKRIGRTFALAAKSVTKEQFLRFLPTFAHKEMRRYPDATCPIGGIVWHEAAEYCNWLSKQEGIAKEQ